MAGPYVYPNPMSLVGNAHVTDIAGNQLGECVSLVKRYITELQNRRSTTWVEGVNVIETIRNGGTILEGTAIATFKNGRFISGNGHAAFYVNFENHPGGIRIRVVEQYSESVRIISRLLFNWGRNADGSYRDASNSGEAFSVIL